MPHSANNGSFRPSAARDVDRLGQQKADVETFDGELSGMEEHLQDNGQHGRSPAGPSISGLFIIQDGSLRRTTQRLADMFGCKGPAELLDKQLWKFAHPDDRALVWHLLKGLGCCRQTTSPYRFRGLRADGATIWLELDTVESTFEGKPAQVCNLVDISAHHKAGENREQNRRHLEQHVASRTDELQQANRRLHKEIAERKEIENRLVREKQFSHYIIESLPGIFYVLNQEGRFLEWNRNLELVGGYTTEEVSKMTAMDFYTGQEKELIAQ